MSDFIKYEHGNGDIEVKVDLKGGNTMHIISPKKESDFIKVNVVSISHEDIVVQYRTTCIIPRNELHLMISHREDMDYYLAISEQLGSRTIAKEEYDRLCKELGVE